MLQPYLLQCDVASCVGVAIFVDGASAIDLAVGALSYLFETDVVGDGACGERPAMQGVVG